MNLKQNLKKMIIPVLGLSLLFPSAGSAAEQTPTVKTPAADLRAALDQLLSEHYILAVSSMTKSFEGATDAEALTKALDQNALDMTPAIASIYGEEGAAEFERIFRGHNGYADTFVQAAKNNDEAARQEAEKEVEEFVEEFSTFLGKATEGKLPAEAAAKAVSLHEDQVIQTFDHYVEGEYEEAYKSFREGYKHMFSISKALSSAITAQMPEKFANSSSDTPAADLRSALNSLASEHFALAVMGMEKGYTQSEDYDFITWAENANTADFKAAIGSIYGEAGAQQFEKVWQTDHINAQGKIAAAELEGDKEAAEAARAQLDKFAKDFGGFLGAATDGNLPAADAEAAVKAHENQVLMAFDQYKAGNYEESAGTFREGFAAMFTIGEVLGNAIVTQMPDKFAEAAMPESMPKTGLGGASNPAEAATILWSVLGVMLAAGGVFSLRKKAVK